MKILTLTTQFANNMGALLQCYSLSHFLNEQKGLECEIIQYFPKQWKESWTIFHKPACVRDVLKMFYQALNIRKIINGRHQNSLTRLFIKNYFPLHKNKYFSPESIKKSPPRADVYICGSDQIWNFNLFQDLTYYLDFTYSIPNCKRIAYAPSIAEDWTVEQRTALQPYINKFDALSIREHGNLDTIKRVTVKDVKIVIDPVFLLDADDWLSIASTPSFINTEEPYILCYFISVSPLAVKTVQKMRELTGLKVVYLNQNAIDRFKSENEIRVFDPRMFVGLISKAEYICTNSFHCTAFSIIFRRNFIYIPGMRNKRVETLEEVFSLGDRFASEQRLSGLSKDDLTVDYSKGEENGKNYIKESKSYLLNAIYKTN